MPAPRYHFVTRWHVTGTIEEVADVLSDPLDLPRWWPDVYLQAIEHRAANGTGIGRRVQLHTRGWLPYTLRWELEVVESDYPRGFAIVATGDFDGQGRWTFRQNGPTVTATFEWSIAAEKPLLKHLSWLLRPVFAANHQWAMARGQVSLERELARRRLPPAER